MEDWGDEFSFIRRRPCPVWQAPGIMMLAQEPHSIPLSG